MTETFATIPALHTTLPDCAIVRATTGIHDQDWSAHKAEYCDRLSSILSSWHTDPSSYLVQLNSFAAPPHTIQRLAELLDDPSQWYTSPEKYCRALDRVLNVTFTTLDYSTEKEEFESMHHDSPLIPIPWLKRESMTGEGEEEAAHENGTLAETVSDHAKIATGSAPMDAADYGPQSEDVKEAIATGTGNGALAETHAHSTSNGDGSHLDQSM